MVTARADTHDVVAGLEAGADDYLTKPFAPKELSARIRALLRRARTADPGVAHLRFGDLEIIPDEGVVLRDGDEVHLTKTEFRLLVELASSPGRVFSREVLLERVWGYGYFGDGRLVDVHIRRLRTKIETDPANPRHVVTVRGLGLQAPDLTPRAPASRARACRERAHAGMRFRPARALRPPRPHHRHLRARCAAALGAPVAGITCGLTRENLLNQRERAPRPRHPQQRRATSTPRASGPDVDNVDRRSPRSLTSTRRRDAAPPLPATRGPPATRLEFDEHDLPGRRSQERGRRAASRRACARLATASPSLVVGVPIPRRVGGASYFEGVPLDDSKTTLDGLAISLARRRRRSPPSPAASLGFWASRRVLKPLTEVGRAAEAIAGGRLDTRLVIARRRRPRRPHRLVQRHGPALQDRIERDARFASEVSHELRSPLMTLAASSRCSRTARRAPRARPHRARPAVGRRRALPAAGRGPARDLPLRRRRRCTLELDEVLVADMVHPGGERHRRPRRARRSYEPEDVTEWWCAVDKRRIGAGAGQPARQRREVRRRRHVGPGRARPNGRHRAHRRRGRRPRRPARGARASSSTASPAAARAAAAAPTAASASAWPSSTSTSACTAAGSGSRTASTGGPAPASWSSCRSSRPSPPSSWPSRSTPPVELDRDPCPPTTCWPP